MPRTLTFIHAADLHIGAPFRGLRGLSDTWADCLVEAIPKAFDRIVDEACERNVDFVIIAGDIFDEACASFAHYTHLFNGIERLRSQGIPVYMCTGNHDPYATWRSDFFALPDNVTMFSAEHPDFALYERNGEPLCVLGSRGILNSVSHKDDPIAQGITRDAANEVLGERAKEAPFGVGILHTGLDVDQKSAPATSPKELLQAGYDYWALGHIHKSFIDNEENPRMAFSGNIQGRDIKEVGRRGVNLVTLTEGAPNRVEFISTAVVEWEQFDVDVEQCANISDIVTAIRNEQFRINADALCEKMVCRVTLIGATPLHETLRHPENLEDIRNTINNTYREFFIDALIDKTTAPLDKDALRTEGLFPAVFLRTADDIRADENQEILYLQENLQDKGLSVASAGAVFPDIDALSEEATNLVLDLLMHEESA